jgi:site-specific recombinase XerC
MDFDSAIGEWLADLELAGRQNGTRKKHREEMERLARWCSEQSYDWQQLTRKQLTAYTRLRAGLSHSTRSNMLCTLRTYFRWAVEQEYVALSPAATFKTPVRPKPLPRALTLDQVRTLVRYLLELASAGRREQRDAVLLLTALYAGLRAAELAGLRWSMLDIAGGVINIRLSKMNKGRSVKIHPALAGQLASWRELQALGNNSPVFSLDGKAINPNRVGKIARQIARATGLPLTTHVLRHTFATHSLRKSGNLYAVSKALGHSQLRQTEIYLAADVSDSEAAVDSLPALDSW